MAHDWPGNVRELENFVERALIQSSGENLDIDSLLASIRPSQPVMMSESSDPAQPFPTLDLVCARHIRHALGRTREKISGSGGAAGLLGLHPNTLRQRMDKLGIAYKKTFRRKK